LSSRLSSGRRLVVAGAVGAGLSVAAMAVRKLATTVRPGHPYFAGSPLLIAHRGGAGLAPENTLLAFRRALEWWEADMLELDVRATRDGEVVVIHDDTVDRTTDGRGAVADHGLDQLLALDAGYRFSVDGGRSYPFRGRGVRIPTLREVIQSCRHARINVEVKDGRAQERVWEVVHELGATNRVLLASGRSRNRRQLLTYSGARSASAEEMYLFLTLQRLRATALFATRIDAFQMPEHHGGRQVLDPRLVRELHAKNLPVHVWTVNEAADMNRLLDWGVDGIITDRPDRLARVLHARVGRPLPPGAPSDATEPFMERLLLAG
jgi:glycerophosphoryl diester phosphodiesterase